MRLSVPQTVTEHLVGEPRRLVMRSVADGAAAPAPGCPFVSPCGFTCVVHEPAERPRRPLSGPGHVMDAVTVVHIWVWCFLLFRSYIYAYFNILKFSDFCFVLWPPGCDVYFLTLPGEHLLRGRGRASWSAPRLFSAGSPEHGVTYTETSPPSSVFAETCSASETYTVPGLCY